MKFLSRRSESRVEGYVHIVGQIRRPEWLVVGSTAIVAAVVLLCALVLVGPTPPVAADAQPAPGTIAAGSDIGREIFQSDCAVCHGARGQGSPRGPDITESGTASVDFMVRTGRMPMSQPELSNGLPWSVRSRDTKRAAPRYDEDQIRSLVAYTAGFINGPEVPSKVDTSDADLARGGDIYRAQCASCHQMAGSGGSLAYGVVGPPLKDATPTEVIEAIRTGPGSMPVFPDSVISRADGTNLAAYVEYLARPEDRGGISLWHLGPVPEGLVAWVLGLGGIVLFARWLGKSAFTRE